MHRWWVGALVLTWSGVAAADAVPPGPPDCPDGHESTSDHGGPYCQPPLPTNCPPEHEPRVRRTVAYCEPPPEKPCPPGSSWTSDGPSSLFCRGTYSCEKEGDCGDQGTCVEADLCVTVVEVFRAGSYQVVHGLCEDGCEGEGRKCVEAKRCDPKTKRVASSPEAAKGFDPATGETVAPTTTPTTTPGSEPSVPTAKPSSGCGSCGTGSGGNDGISLWLVAGLGWLARRRRR